MLDDGFAHVCRDEDGGGGAEGEDLLQDLAAVEIVVVELYGVGVCLLVVAGLFVVAREHHEAVLDGVVLTLDAQGHALAAVREKLMEGFLCTCGDWRVKALDRREIPSSPSNSWPVSIIPSYSNIGQAATVSLQRKLTVFLTRKPSAFLLQ